MDDPDFMYNYVRPVVVVSALMFWFWVGGRWRAHHERKREEREKRSRDVTPR